jgi:hypothetical protein
MPNGTEVDARLGQPLSVPAIKVSSDLLCNSRLPGTKAHDETT